MIDLAKLQEDWLAKLLSEPALDCLNVMGLRKEVIANRVDFALLTKTARSGRMGAGAVVEMPTITVPQQNAPGPQVLIELTTLVAEMPTLNMSASSGTLISAEEWAMRILDVGHRFYHAGWGEFVAAKQALEPSDFPQAGHVAYRVRMTCLGGGGQTQQVQGVTATRADGLLTLACGTEGADIYYTTDGGFPGPGNSAAVRYAGPVADPGEVLAAAYKAGMRGSDVHKTEGPE